MLSEGDGDRPPLWHCPRCGRRFAATGQVHTCAPLGALDDLFARSEPAVRQTFDAVLTVVRGFGPVEVLAQRTRVALHVRMSFAAFQPRRRWLDGHMVLDRRLDSDRFRLIHAYSARNVLHAVRLTSPSEVDDEMAGWLWAAYRVGQQWHRG